MEICILIFDGTHVAERALQEVADAEADRHPWLNDVGVVSRPLVGRITIHATFPDGRNVAFHEGELGSKAGDIGAYTGYLLGGLIGPLHASMLALKGARTFETRISDAEKKFFHVDEIKDLLLRGSSALVLVADTPICDEMTRLFAGYEMQVYRRDVAQELQQRLETIREQSMQQFRERADERAATPP